MDQISRRDTTALARSKFRNCSTRLYFSISIKTLGRSGRPAEQARIVESPVTEARASPAGGSAPLARQQARDFVVQKLWGHHGRNDRGSLTGIHQLDNEAFPVGFCQPMQRMKSGILVQTVFQPADRGTVEAAPSGNIGET